MRHRTTLSMKLQADSNPKSHLVRAYGRGFFVVNDERHTTSIIVSPDRLQPCAGVHRLEDIDARVLAEVAEFDPEILLVGTGREHQLPGTEVLIRLAGIGVGVEVMRSDAACRTYNVLAAEDRRVVALLMLILED